MNRERDLDLLHLSFIFVDMMMKCLSGVVYPFRCISHLMVTAFSAYFFAGSGRYIEITDSHLVRYA